MTLERLTWCEIGLNNLNHNLKTIKNKIGSVCKVIAVVKANAYGHGALSIALNLEGKVWGFGVACLGEALELRRGGVRSPVLILGYTPGENFSEIVKNNITIILRSLDVAKSLSSEARRKGKIVKIHLKIDTGMHRIGLNPSEAIFFYRKIRDLPNLKVEGVFTHFADADNRDQSFTRRQLAEFKAVLRELEENGFRPSMVHAANSAAIFNLPESHFNAVRPGISLYGLNPFGGDSKSLGLKPIMTLKSRLVQVKELGVGEPIGYGCSYKTKRKTIVGTMAVGYADGFRRSPKNWGEVLIHGKSVSILGRVAMDACQIDLTDIPQARVGDEVVLIGRSAKEELTAEMVAQKLGTINYEVVSSIANRVERVYFKRPKREVFLRFHSGQV